MGREPDEILVVTLQAADHAVLGRSQGVGIILNDDGRAGEVDSFIWDPIGAAHGVGQPLPVTLTARDALGDVVTTFSGTAGLMVEGHPSEYWTIDLLEDVPSRFPLDSAKCTERVQVVYPVWVLNGPGRIASLALDVTAVPGQVLSNWTVRFKHSNQPLYLPDFEERVWEWDVVVNLSAPAGLLLTADFGTADGTARAGTDYLPHAGRLEFPAGTTSQRIPILVRGDLLAEASEQFFVRLSPGPHLLLVDPEGVGTIVNDDGTPGALAWLGFPDEPAWETNGWTTVLQSAIGITNAGWAWFPLSPPFEFNGVDGLMVDITLDGDSAEVNSSCTVTSHETVRTLYGFADEATNPLSWSGRDPVPQISHATPNLRLDMSAQTILPVEPAEAGVFLDGLWTGDLILPEAGTDVFLVAQDPDGHTGVSAPFTVEPATDADADDLPDCWEQRFFGAIDNPDGQPHRDPDADGLTHEQECRAGTHPLDALSTLRLVSVESLEQSIRLRFTTAAGKRYQLEGTPDLADSPWTPAGESLIGTGTLMEATLPANPPQAARFYRVRLVTRQP